MLNVSFKSDSFQTAASCDSGQPSCFDMFQVRPVETSHTKKRCKVPPQPQVTADHTVILVPGSFDVILLVDKQETTG